MTALEKITVKEVKTLKYLLANKANLAIVSDMSENLGISKKTVHNHLTKLEECGMIKYSSSRIGFSSIIKIERKEETLNALKKELVF